MVKRLKRKRKTVEAVGAGTPAPDVFEQEMMSCPICGRQQQADPARQSGWTALQLDASVKGYFCPDCWHTIGRKHGYENMTLMAVGICMGSTDMLTLAKSLVK